MNQGGSYIRNEDGSLTVMAEMRPEKTGATASAPAGAASSPTTAGADDDSGPATVTNSKTKKEAR